MTQRIAALLTLVTLSVFALAFPGVRAFAQEELPKVSLKGSDDTFDTLPEITGRSPASSSGSDSPQAIKQALGEGNRMMAQGYFFQAAALYFNVYTAPVNPYVNYALGLVTENLIQSGFPNAASYFFIKTLQSEDRGSIHRVLRYLPVMIDYVGGDLLRKYLIRYTRESDYDATTRSHFNYFLGKDELLKGNPQAALAALSKVSSGNNILAQAAYLRGTAYAMLGQMANSIASFKSCESLAGKVNTRSRRFKQEYSDLEARCTAGLARAYYQAGNFSEAEETYDNIPKSSFVWTDILFEQAWNAYAKGDYNRALGKLVTYRSPALSFVFNPEVEVLRAQSFFALCAYDDVNKTANEFTQLYGDVGGKLKNYLLSHVSDLGSYFSLGKEAYYRKLHTTDMLHRALNRFVRGPYFASMVYQERNTQAEASRVRSVGAREGVRRFAGFLSNVLSWRKKSVRLLGGAFVKNSMVDLYHDLLTNLDKMSFIKLEMLKYTKQTLQHEAVMSEDEDGTLKRGKPTVDRRDYQYFWNFNGEFWADELGDYVFALESQCGS